MSALKKITAFFNAKVDQYVKNEIHERMEEEEILDEVIDRAVDEGIEIIDEKLRHLFRDFFIKIFINLSPVLIGLIIYLLYPTDIGKKILIISYSISIIIGLYEFVKYCVESWKFLLPLIQEFIFLKKTGNYSPILFKMRIKSYFQDKFLLDKLYFSVADEGNERIKEKLNKNKNYKKLQKVGYKYEDVDNDANDLAEHVVYETYALDVIWEELVKYIKYSLLTKWLFSSILIVSYIIIFRMFILPIIIRSI